MPSGAAGGGGGGPQFFYSGGGGGDGIDPRELFSRMFEGEDPFSGMFGAFGGQPGTAKFSFGGMPGGMGAGPRTRGQSKGGMPGGMGGGFPGMGGMGGFPGMGGMGGMPGMGGMGGGFPGMGGMGGMPGMGGGFPGMGGMGGQAPSRPDVIPDGQKVVIHDLKAAQHNGKIGTIRAFDESKQRYVVELPDGETMALKQKNIQQIIEGVKLRGLESKPELNGKSGTIIMFSPENERYQVRLAMSNDVLALKPANVVLPDKTRVRIFGLSGAAQYNDKWGQIESFDKDSGRFNVRVAGGKVLALKPDNCQA